MIKLAILAACLIALGFAVSACRLPCGEPLWKKEGACHDSGPVN
jgi:hypothetical protein